MSAQPLEIRMAHLEGAYEQISERLNGIDGRLTALDQKIDTRFDAFERKIDARFGTVDRRFETIDRKIDIMGGRFMVAILGSNAAVLAAIVGAILTIHR
jgi:tetrahydromethanopterin S-methyltransferase subunit G